MGHWKKIHQFKPKEKGIILIKCFFNVVVKSTPLLTIKLVKNGEFDGCTLTESNYQKFDAAQLKQIATRGHSKRKALVLEFCFAFFYLGLPFLFLIFFAYKINQSDMILAFAVDWWFAIVLFLVFKRMQGRKYNRNKDTQFSDRKIVEEPLAFQAYMNTLDVNNIQNYHAHIS